MKTLGKFLLISLLGVVILSGCSKNDDDDNNQNNNNPTTGALNCKVDGNDWTASLAVVASNSGGLVTITGSDSNSKQCQVAIYNVSGTGTYQIGGRMTNPNTGRWTEGLGQNDTYMTQLGLGSGTVEITELTATGVKGTFSFTAKNGEGTEVSLTIGSSNATFSE